MTDSTFAFETNSDPGQFVPVHIHPTQDEFILVQEGVLDLKLDGVWVQAKAGDLVRLPRGIPHGYFNKSDKPARALFWVSPMQKLEALFNQLHNLTDPAEVVRISAQHEVNFLPPEANEIGSTAAKRSALNSQQASILRASSLLENVVMVRRKQVCIIGAGVSGLAAARRFAARGHQITIVERSGDLGGVWEPARSYPDVQTQSPKDLYRYTDKAMPESYPEWPKRPAGPRLSHRLRQRPRSRSARSASTRPCCRWIAAPMAGRAGGCDLRGRTAASATRTSISSPSAPDSSTSRRRSACPAKRPFKAQGGRILHSSQYNDPAIAKGRKVVVLGGSKSATDIAVNAVNSGAAEVTHRLSRAGVADSLLHRRPGQLQAHSLHPRPGRDVPELGHRRDVAVRASRSQSRLSGPTGADWRAC